MTPKASAGVPPSEPTRPGGTLLLLLLAAAHAASVDPEALSGTWALEMAAVTTARVPILGEVESTTRTAALVVLTCGPDGDWVQHHDTCGSDVSGGGLVRTRVPAAAYSSIPPKLLQPSVTESASELRYAVDLQPFVGDWDSSRCATVLREADDPCIVDGDGDGEPGVTMKVKLPLFPWVDVYVAQHAHPHLDGVVVGTDRIEGELWVTDLDNRVLGASVGTFARSPEDAHMLPSTFTMSRVDPDATCATVLELLDIAPSWS